MIDASGKTVLVTGATDGLGRAVACQLAAAGATVLVHGRDAQRLEAAAADVGDAATADPPRTYLADFASLTDVGRMANEIAAAEPRIDVLINNAGIGTSGPGGDARSESEDGYELRFAVNYLAGWALTRRLLDTLKGSAREERSPTGGRSSTAPTSSRIVNVSSAGQMAIDFDDVMLEHGYSGGRAYCQSKLAQILFTRTLADELGDSGVTATCLHPATYMPTKIVPSPISSLQEGVDATLRLAVDPDVEGVTGVYFNGLSEATPDPQAADPGARRRLEDLSEQLVERA